MNFFRFWIRFNFTLEITDINIFCVHKCERKPFCLKLLSLVCFFNRLKKKVTTDIDICSHVTNHIKSLDLKSHAYELWIHSNIWSHSHCSNRLHYLSIPLYGISEMALERNTVLGLFHDLKLHDRLWVIWFKRFAIHSFSLNIFRFFPHPHTRVWLMLNHHSHLSCTNTFKSFTLVVRSMHSIRSPSFLFFFFYLLLHSFFFKMPSHCVSKQFRLSFLEISMYL